MQEKFRSSLQEYNKFIKDEISMIENGARLSSIAREMKPKQKQLRNQIMQLAKQVANTGQLQSEEWPLFKNFTTILVKEALDKFNAKFKDSKTFEEEKQVILQYLVFFDNPPFTLQRIVELALQPEKYYQSCRKILYAFEKLVNVADPQER